MTIQQSEAAQDSASPAHMGQVSVAGATAAVLGSLLGVLVGAGLAWLALNGYLTPGGEQAAWYLTRSTATVAYLLLSAATIWGLLLSTKLVKAWVPAPLALALHSALSWLAIGLGAGHALLLLGDTYLTYRWTDLVIPFVGPYEPFWVGLGTLSLYGLVIVSASFWVRSRLGTTLWRRLHYTTLAFYVLITAHGLMAGSDAGKPQMQAMYALSAIAVLFLTNVRWIGTALAGRASAANPTDLPQRPHPGLNAFSQESQR